MNNLWNENSNETFLLIFKLHVNHWAHFYSSCFSSNVHFWTTCFFDLKLRFFEVAVTDGIYKEMSVCRNSNMLRRGLSDAIAH